MAKMMPFKDVPVGTKLKFPFSPFARKITIYTKAEPTAKWANRTITYEESGETCDAFCSPLSETMVEIVED